MQLAAVFHRPMSEYAHALDARTYVFRLRAAKGDLRQCRFFFADRAAMTPDLAFTAVPMPRVRRDLLYDWFEITLRTDFLRIAYCFELQDERETRYYMGNRFEASADQNRSDYFQFPFNLRADRLEIPAWAQDAVVYNIFPDSFANGKRRMVPQSVEVPYRGERCRALLGGTIRGICENLEYIRTLGCNCVYLNPVFAANAYHKYDSLDYYRIDPAFGTDEDFRQLVGTAHGMGMRVLIDGVFNHIGWRHPFFQDVLAKGKASPYYGWFYDLPDVPRFPQAGEAADYVCFAYVPEMPKLNTANPEAKKYFCEVGAYWVRAFHVDGWRLDVANEVDDGFLRAFRDTVKRENPDALVIGEVWENAVHYINGNMMDGAMSYDFRRFCTQFFAKRSLDAAAFDLRVSDLLMRYPKQALPAQLNLLDSHDVSRFLTLCGGDRAKMELAILFQMTFIGIPTIFYGNEKGLTGETEPDYRRPMDFDRQDALEGVYRRLIRLRAAHAALRKGDFRTVWTHGQAYGYQRGYRGETIAVTLNAGEEAVAFSAPGEILLQKRAEGGLLYGNGYVVSKLN